jgi:hypothetical protein
MIFLFHVVPQQPQRLPRLIQQSWLLLCLLLFHNGRMGVNVRVVDALYVSYEEPNLYRVGDRYVLRSRCDHYICGTGPIWTW